MRLAGRWNAVKTPLPGFAPGMPQFGVVMSESKNAPTSPLSLPP